MPIRVPLQPSHFYDVSTNNNRSGDIWNGLPTFGIIPRPTTRGIIITPACDLANKKCESISYLPIMSIHDYLGSAAFRYDCWIEIQPLLSRLDGYKEIPEPDRFDLLPLDCLIFAEIARKDTTGKALTENELARLAGYIRYIKSAHEGTANVTHLKHFIKPDRLTSILSRLLTNASKADLHFLPADGYPASYSATPEHSVVLFRYPMSIPIEILNRSQYLDDASWPNYLDNNKVIFPTLGHMPEWPIKLSTLRNEFFADMISRYINMYIRLGSVDFEDQTVRDFSDQIRGQ